MTIHNQRAFLASIWDWKPLRGCFPRRVEPTDIDGLVELGGYFFVLEGKGTDVPIPDGQRMVFDRMMRWNQTVPDLFTIVIIWGDAEQGRVNQVQFWPSPPFSAGWDSVKEYAKAWAERVEERAAIQDADEIRQKAVVVPPLAPKQVSATRELTADDIHW